MFVCRFSLSCTPLSKRGVRVLYVTPLRALNNDVYEHIVGFAAEWRGRLQPDAAEQYAIHAAVRTGDTPQSTRASILRNPPDVLVTTPESLYLMLTSPKARAILRHLRKVRLRRNGERQRKRGCFLRLTRLIRMALACLGPNKKDWYSVERTVIFYCFSKGGEPHGSNKKGRGSYTWCLGQGAR